MGRSYLPEAWVRCRDPRAAPAVKALAAVLSSYADGDFGNQDVWPSPQTICEDLGLSARHIQNLGDAGEALGWWTRLRERTRHGGIMLSWRLHFPVFTANRSPSEAERQYSADGHDHSGSPSEAERKPIGSPSEAERNWSADGRVEGFKDARQEGLKAPVQSEIPGTAPKGRTKKPPRIAQPADAIVEAWNRQTAGVRARATVAGQTGTILAARWKAHPDVAWWDDLFASHVEQAGRGRGWREAFLEWALREKQFDRFAFDAGTAPHESPQAKQPVDPWQPDDGTDLDRQAWWDRCVDRWSLGEMAAATTRHGGRPTSAEMERKLAETEAA